MNKYHVERNISAYNSWDYPFVVILNKRVIGIFESEIKADGFCRVKNSEEKKDKFTLEEIAFEIVMRNKPLEPLSRKQADMQITIINLLIALHDAINSDNGDIPISANDYYCQDHFDSLIK